MSVRKTALIIAMFAIIACGVGSVQADAASTSRGQEIASLPTSYGEHCVKVRSNLHGRTGTICAHLVDGLGKEQGEVTFTASSGLVRTVFVKILQISMNNQVIETAYNVSKTVMMKVGDVSIAKSWWDEPDSIYMRVGAFDACITWTDGGKACTGPHWLYGGQ